MKRKLLLLTLVALVVVAGVAVWLARLATKDSSVSPTGPHTVESVLTNAVESAKKRLTGGVGVLLRPDNGQLLIQGVGVGSPAEAAGLHVGDVILSINGTSIAGMPLAQVVHRLHGFTGGRVELTVQRAGSANLTCLIRRASWNTLLGTTFNQASGSNTPAPLSPLSTPASPTRPVPR